MNAGSSNSGLQTAVLAIRALTSRVPRIRGVGVILSWVAAYFRKYGVCEVQVTAAGWEMLLNTGDAIGNVMIFTPQWHDPVEREIIKHIIKPGDYVVDVGANIGVYTLMFAGLVGARGRVLAIEAEANNSLRLHHNIEINSVNWVNVCNVGVSDKVETLPMLIDTCGNAGAHSFYAVGQENDAVLRSTECVPLYSLLENRRPQLIKIDIEGFEWRVLRRYFEDAPRNMWANYVLLEDDPRHREQDAVALLTGIGYQVMRRIGTNTFLVRS